MNIIDVSIPQREYKIKIENGLLSQCGKQIAEISSPCKVAIITDDLVAPLYGDQVLNSLKDFGFEPFLITIPNGEGSKSLEMLKHLYDEVLRLGLTRTDLVVALGGGVVGDLSGFCAATLFRGIDFVQIPTTLLAQVDSSVGGKTAVNLSQGKNLVGAFYQPKLVLIDPLCLESLSDKNFSDGMAEVIKYGVILDKDLFQKIENSASRKAFMNSACDIISRCCDLKRTVVEKDETDKALRMILNFGHTFGHAIEKKYKYQKYTHGEAVAVGMVMAAELGENLAFCPPGVSQRIEKLLKAFNLPHKAKINEDDFLNAVAVDKKGSGNFVSLILPLEIGSVTIKNTEKNSIWIW